MSASPTTLVESLDKDWEDSDSEQQDLNETDPLEASPNDTENPLGIIKEEIIEVFDPNAIKSTETSRTNSPRSVDYNGELAKSIDQDENLHSMVSGESLSCASIDLPPTETQRFVVQINADEITLMPDTSIPQIPTSEPVKYLVDAIDKSELPADMPDILSSVNADQAEVSVSEETSESAGDVIDEPHKSVDMPVIFSPENVQPQIAIKKKRTVKPVCKRERVIPTKNVENKAKRQKLETENGSNVVPSVYSFSEIKRHKKRLTLKALQDDSSSAPDSDSESDEERCDPDLDVNLRIIEGSGATSVENVIIGEIHCDVVAEDKGSQEATNEKLNKNTSVFKLSVNADFSKKSQTKQIQDESKEEISYTNTDDEDADDIVDAEDVDGLCSLYDDDFFSDNDSDLEILTSKSIVRKRSTVPTSRKDKPTDSDRKTMYDLIYDTMQPASRQKEKSNDLKSKVEPKKRAPKKTKNGSIKKQTKASSKEEDTKESDVTNVDEADVKELDVTELDNTIDTKTSDAALPVPQLKVNADGQVIIDTESLTIEQTGVAEARQAIANSEVVEESGLNYRSYSKKNNFRKQWSPHDTLKFYDVLSVVGTDFTLMATLFPGRTRNCIKRKYKREEKANRDLIMKALTCKQKFNIGLLEKELKVKEEKVNLMKKNAKKEKEEKEKEEKLKKSLTKKTEPKAVKSRAPGKRKSFFERGISCFTDS